MGTEAPHPFVGHPFVSPKFAPVKDPFLHEDYFMKCNSGRVSAFEQRVKST